MVEVKLRFKNQVVDSESANSHTRRSFHVLYLAKVTAFRFSTYSTPADLAVSSSSRLCLSRASKA